MEPETTAAEWWLKTGSVYGLGFAFLGVFVAICLYAFWKITLHGIGLMEALRLWLPQWFGAQVESFKKASVLCDTLCESQRETTTQLGEISKQISEHRRECGTALAAVQCRNYEPKR